MARSDLTDITVICDRSGSMESIRRDMIGGFNSFIEQQKRDNQGELRVSLVMFDSPASLTTDAFVYDNCNVHNIPAFDLVPRGNTALFDAVGTTIDRIGTRLANTPEHERPGSVVVMIITDGAENASVKYTASMVREKISHQTDVYKWTFVFLGANHNSFDVADRLNIQRSNTMNYAANRDSVDNMYVQISSKVSAMRGGEQYTSGGVFVAEDYAKQDALGARNAEHQQKGSAGCNTATTQTQCCNKS